MAKIKTVFTCQNCGAQRPRWEGKCTDCNGWNTFVEEQQVNSSDRNRGWSLGKGSDSTTRILKLNEPVNEIQHSRLSTGLGEVDRVLGGGLVRGSYILIGGDPGIGKSTLMLQITGSLAKSHSVLYVSAEESVEQTALRAKRLNVNSGNIEVASESQMDKILNLAQEKKPDVLIVDSIQTVYLTDVASAPGSVSQVRECAGRLMELAKGRGISVFIIGHVTKDGSLAGPRVLEHMVDTVLSFEGESAQQFRLLRALKNRFGATNELGVFQMSSLGLREVSNPSEFFLEERGNESIGSAIFSAMEGSRPLLCEIQALATSSPLAMPRRTTLGIDVNRLHMILAVLDKYLNTDNSHSDIFVNIVGGLHIKEPAADLPVAAALLSSLNNQCLPRHCCFLGELGLTGEIRAVNFLEERLREAEKLGFKQAVLPLSNKKHLSSAFLTGALKLHFLDSINSLEKIMGNLTQAKKHTGATTCETSF